VDETAYPLARKEKDLARMGFQQSRLEISRMLGLSIGHSDMVDVRSAREGG